MGEPPGLSLGQYASVLRGRWMLILITTVLGGLVAAGYLVLTPTMYTATAAVQINVISSDPFQSSQSASDLIDGSTEASIASSFAVASLAAEEFDANRTPNEIREYTEATPVADATVLQISYTSTTPENARDGADALTQAYLSYRESQASVRLSSMIEMIDDQLTGLRRELVDANAQAAVAEPDSSDANQAASDRDLITIEINSLITRKNVLESINTSGGVILTPARENPLETAPSAKTVAASGVLGGILLGVVLAFLVKGLDRRVTSNAEIERLAGAEVLGHLPGRLGTVPPSAADMEALRLVRERVLANLAADSRTLLIVNRASRSSGHVDVAANIALAFAQERNAVELVLPALSGEDTKAVTTALQLEVTHESPELAIFRSNLLHNFTVVIAEPGSPISDPDPHITRAVRERMDLRSSDGLRVLALDATARAPSLLAAHRYSDASILAVAMGKTHADSIDACVAEMRVSGTPLLGVLTLRRDRISNLSADVRDAKEPARR